MYTPPWMRINPYIIGMVTGYILIKLNNNAVSRRKVIILCWFLASLCIVYVLFVIVIYKRHVSILVSAIYVALHRIFWAIGITGIVIACSTKHGGCYGCGIYYNHFSLLLRVVCDGGETMYFIN
ncbi:PREDICTED: uncharacterized protein LOC105570745 [Vollenhovia emeryi]|uniref:uncharacterized protein LOC105570745 n=1 Tax=Vollenhovia emeryi TaxID=411798 RepID=UPI0005F474FF|nr:PREDICTED: uncharacterized protein LOC105570745 [Vollenhovia emeryi]